MTRITLLTDFGTRDGYAAAMHGVIAAIAPDVRVIDASHDIPPGDIRSAAWTLRSYWNLFPAGTVHVIVIDPGVGTSRRGVAAAADGRVLVAPDNGVLSLVLDEAIRKEVRFIENTQWFRSEVSNTFHGRDVFAPVAAHLALGAPFRSAGPLAGELVRLSAPEPRRQGADIHGEVVHVDRFGNLITSIPGAWITRDAEIEISTKQVGSLRSAYGDVERGELVALIGSSGRLEIAVHRHSAAERLGLGLGTPVVVRRGNV